MRSGLPRWRSDLSDRAGFPAPFDTTPIGHCSRESGSVHESEMDQGNAIARTWVRSLWVSMLSGDGGGVMYHTWSGTRWP